MSTSPDVRVDGAEFIHQRELETQNQEVYRRRVLLPVLLFLFTCASTFLVGALLWSPGQVLATSQLDGSWMVFRRLLLANWETGLVYMVCLIAILLLHELGHFVATLIYRIPASFPMFLPMPITPIGTMGAVIAMQGHWADRKQIFDIGIAGPIAGLVVAIPLTFVGISQLDLTDPPRGGLGFQLPLAMHWLAVWYDVPGYVPGQPVWLNQLTPVFTAAWVGLLITGFNMMPVSQLDGGHVAYTLFGPAAHWIARTCIVIAIAFMVYHQTMVMLIMVVLILIFGTDHPETRDDNVRLGPFRWILGLVSLSIPILCFPPLIFELIE